MVEKMRKELWELAEQRRRRESVEKEVERLRQEESAIWREDYQARTRCSKIKEEIEGLEDFSVRNIWYDMTGRKDELLDQLEVQLREAEVEQKDIQSAMEECSLRLQSQEAAQTGFGDLDRRYQEIYARICQTLREQGGAEGAQVAQAEKTIETLERLIRETEQALEAGAQVLQSVRSIRSILEEMGSRGGKPGQKRRIMDNMREQLAQIQKRMRLYNREAEDLEGLELSEDMVLEKPFGETEIAAIQIDEKSWQQLKASAVKACSAGSRIQICMEQLEQLRRKLIVQREKQGQYMDRLVWGTEMPFALI